MKATQEKTNEKKIFFGLEFVFGHTIGDDRWRCAMSTPEVTGIKSTTVGVSLDGDGNIAGYGECGSCLAL